MSQPLYPENKMKSKLRNNEHVIGMCSNSGSPTLIEMMGYAGFDFVVIETEHTPLTLDGKTSHLIKAAELAGLTPLIRVRDNESSLIHKALDIGSQGIFCPHVESKEEAQKLVDAVKYPPLGDRSGGPGRYLGPHRYAIDKESYPDYWNRESIVMFLIESKKGLDNLEEIVTVAGIDVIGIGQGDLSLSLGNWSPRFQHQECVMAVEKLLTLCRPRGIAVRESFNDIKMAKKWCEKGIRVFELGSDTSIFQKNVRKMMNEYRDLSK